jgi:hypothetical protein
MMAFSIVALQILSCLGLGVLVLRLAKVSERLAIGERYSWSFAIGFGVHCWLLFFVGVLGGLTSAALLVTLAAPVPAVLLLRSALLPPRMIDELGRAGWLVLAAVFLTVLFDAFEVPAPPTDADSIAYHFDIPRRFWEAGTVFFIPRAIDGAAPLLVQMSYIAPYAFGGETALNLWVMATGVAACLLLYTTCRRYMAPSWSFAVFVVFASTPAVLYGAGSGQIEIRLAIFAVVAVIAAGEALRHRDDGFTLIAGLAAGFFAGGKYFGLMFALATGLALLISRGFLKRGALYAGAVTVAGFQWYWWNWLHTGDPVFPMLFPVLGDGGTGFWTQANHEALLGWLSTVDRPVPSNIFWFFAYPFVATLKGFAAFESTRTGLGVFALLILPFALAGAWHFRRTIRIGPMSTAAIVVTVTYGLWFFLASSQRVRYLLPIYPVLLILVSAAAIRVSEKSLLVRPLAAVFVITCVIQLAGQAVFTARYVRYALTDQSREAFSAQGVSRYAVVKWVNDNIDSDAVVMTPYRDIIFLLKPNIFQAHSIDQAIVDVLPNRRDPRRFVLQVRAAGVTHAIANKRVVAGYGESYDRLMQAATKAGCFTAIGEVEAVSQASRTLRALYRGSETIQILKRTDKNCPW